MNRPRTISIRHKQMFIIMLTSAVALLLACAAFMVYDSFAFRAEMVEKVSSLSEVVGNNLTAAIDFNDAATANQTLTALRGEPNIEHARVYLLNGKLFADYSRPGTILPPALPFRLGPVHEFINNRLVVFRPVIQSGEMVGTIEVIAGLDAFHTRLWRYTTIVGVVFVGALLVAFWLSAILGRVVSGPISHLSLVAQRVAQDKNYSVRATKKSDDELGQLTDGFNEMLSQIQARDLELERARNELERRVDQRTKELAGSLSLLNATLESTADGILVVDRHGRIMSCNAKFVAMWGLTGELVANGDGDHLLKCSRTQLKDETMFLKRVEELNGNPELQGVDTLTLKDGRIFESYTQPQRLAGRVVGRVWCFRDITEQKRAEEAVRESQVLYHSLVDQLPVGVFRKDRAGRYVFVNPAFCKIKGLSADQFIGRTVGELASQLAVVEGITPDQSPSSVRGAEHHDRVLRTGEQIVLEEHFPNRPAHDEQYLHVIKSPVIDGAGEIVGSQGILVDITQRKQAEKALAHERNLLHSLLETSPDAIYFKDIHSRFIRCSKYQAALFGVNGPEDMVGKTDFDFFEPEHAQPAFEDEQRIIRTGEAMAGKVELEYWKDGRKTWVISSKMPLRDERGTIIGTFGISKDITELRRAQEEAAREQARFKFIFDSVPIGISLAKVGPDGRLLERFINDAHLHICGLTPEQDQDVTVYARITHPDDAQRQRELARQMEVAKSHQFALEKRYFRFDGKTVWVLFSFQRRRQPEGGHEDLITVVDITKSKEAEEEREKLHRQLLDASRMAGMAEVASNVLHNVGNVLNSVNVSATLLAERFKKSKVRNLGRVVALLDEHVADLAGFLKGDSRGRQVPGYLRELENHLVREYQDANEELESLRKNIEHIKVVVSMQQNYAKVSGQTEVGDVTDLIEDSLRINAGALARHNVQVVRELAPVPRIDVDKHKILQILVNLIRNAKYACDEGGKPEKRLTIRLDHDADWIQIAVIDNGVGIPPENLTRIFNHGFTTRKNGHGFGLHSGALAAKEMGGALLASSEGAGQGATFTLRLPIRLHSDTKQLEPDL